MFKVRTFNTISVKGLDRFSREKYEVASDIGQPEAILLRSHKLQADDLPESIRAVARAGAGVNNVPVADLTDRGVVVFNTPGANANAVKELVMAALLLGSRGIVEGMQYADSLTSLDDAAVMNKQLEAEKKRFRGHEIAGRTLGVIGLGAIGSRVAEMAISMDMKVVGFDPALSVEAAWRLPSQVQRAENLQSLLAKCDYISLHLPLLDATRNLVNKEALASVKEGAVLLNFARGGIVNDADAVVALQEGKLSKYITDFPTPELIGQEGVLLTPHIGASTGESEENCAVMAADQLMDFLENGNIRNSVNFPAVSLERSSGFRIAVANKNVPKMLGNILSILADKNINVIDMLNKSRDEVAYNLLDLEQQPDDETLKAIAGIEGVVSVRSLG